MNGDIQRFTDEINSVGRKTIKLYEEGTAAEQENTRRQLQRFQDECSDIIKRYIGIVPTRVIEDITFQTNDLLRKEIEQSRTKECRETMAHLGEARKNTVDEITNGIHDFKIQGVAKDKTYQQKVDEIEYRVIKAFQTVLNGAPMQKVDVAFSEIRGCSRRTFNNIKEVHEECSGIIERSVIKEVENFETVLQHSQMKTEKDSLDFAAQLKSDYCVTKEDVVKNDIKDIAENIARDAIEKDKEDVGAVIE